MTVLLIMTIQRLRLLYPGLLGVFSWVASMRNRLGGEHRPAPHPGLVPSPEPDIQWPHALILGAQVKTDCIGTLVARARETYSTSSARIVTTAIV